MAVHRGSSAPAVRAHLRAELVALLDTYQPGPTCPWWAKLAALDDGQAVTVAAWQLPGGARPYRVEPGARMLVDSAGRVRPAGR